MRPYLFTSERLDFRRWLDEDIAPFSNLNADPQVMKYFPNLLTTDETQGLISRFEAHFAEYGYGFYAVDTLHDASFIGFIGFMYQTMIADFTPCVEIGWRLQQAAWGFGYATEGAQKCLEYGKQEHNFAEVYSFTAKINVPSEKVMIRLGMEKQGEFLHPKIEEKHLLQPHVLYRIGL